MDARTSNPTNEQQLGAIVIAWSGVSDRLEQLFIHLADLDDAFVVGVFVEKIRDAQLDDVVKSLAAQLEEGPRAAIRGWLANVASARKKRNLYLHGIYFPVRHSDGLEHLYLAGRRVLDRTNGTATPDHSKLLVVDLDKFILELQSLLSSYEELVREHFPYAKRRAPDPVA